VLAVGTIVAGGLLGFTGYFEHFKRHNPMLIHELEQALSVCRAVPRPIRGPLR
jgi:hypothetical protein